MSGEYDDKGNYHSDATGYSETTEEPHEHLCSRCWVWSHADESCDGPRFRSGLGPTFDCPLCTADR